MMGIALDVAGLKEFVRINHDAIDLNTPMLDDFKIHYMTQRRQILNNFRQQATGMTMVLQCLTPIDGSEEVAIAQAILGEYREWIVAELNKLDTLV